MHTPTLFIPDVPKPRWEKPASKKRHSPSQPPKSIQTVTAKILVDVKRRRPIIYPSIPCRPTFTLPSICGPFWKRNTRKASWSTFPKWLDRGGGPWTRKSWSRGSSAPTRTRQGMRGKWKASCRIMQQQAFCTMSERDRHRRWRSWMMWRLLLSLRWSIHSLYHSEFEYYY